MVAALMVRKGAPRHLFDDLMGHAAIGVCLSRSCHNPKLGGWRGHAFRHGWSRASLWMREDGMRQVKRPTKAAAEVELEFVPLFDNESVEQNPGDGRRLYDAALRACNGRAPWLAVLHRVWLEEVEQAAVAREVGLTRQRLSQVEQLLRAATIRQLERDMEYRRGR
jgi:hypothetical protein